MPTVPTIEPLTVTVGDTWEWKRSFSDYPASGGWSLSYSLLNSSDKITINASADGDDFVIDVPAATTAAYTAGVYGWFGHVTKATDRYKIGDGEIEVLADPAVVATLDTLIAGNTNASYSIGTPDGSSRSVSRHEIETIHRLRQYWQGRRNIEIRRERLAQGRGDRGIVKVYL